MFDIHSLNKKLSPELREIAKNLGVPRYQKLKKTRAHLRNFRCTSDTGFLTKKIGSGRKEKRNRIKNVVKNKATNPNTEKDQKKDYRPEDRSKNL